MPRGGKRPGSGRTPDLPLSEREEIAREYHQRMEAWAAAIAMGRDPNMQERWKIEMRMRTLATRVEEPTGSDHRTVVYHRQVHSEMQRLQARLDELPNQCAVPARRAKGVRTRFIRELASEYGVSKRMVARCINEFDFGT